MTIPKFEETFIPILKTLKDGRKIEKNLFFKKIKEDFYNRLTEKELNEKVNNGKNRVNDRID
jgi:restriction system protein